VKPRLISQIDYTYFLLYKRLSKRFRIETLERHWDRLVMAARRRNGGHLD
jgi:hypothetical protein